MRFLRRLYPVFRLSELFPPDMIQVTGKPFYRVIEYVGFRRLRPNEKSSSRNTTLKRPAGRKEAIENERC